MARFDYETFKAELLPLYIGIGIIALGWNLFSYYTPTWQEEIGPQTIWTVIGIVMLAIGTSVIGVASWMRHHTRKLFAANRMFQLAFPQPKTVEVMDYTINEGALQKLGATERAQLEEAKKLAPGTNEVGAKIATRVLLPGGVDAGGFKSLAGGSQGMIILTGDDQMIQLDECVFIPHELIPLDHSQVPIEVLQVAEEQSHFNRGKPIYAVGGLDPRVDRWLRTSIVVQTSVLQSIGFDGIVNRFTARLNRALVEGRLKAITPIRNPDGKLVVPKEVMSMLRVEFRDFLLHQEPLKLAMGRNHAGEVTWMKKYYGAVSELNLALARIRQKDHTIYEADKFSAGRVTDRSAVYGGGRSEPGYDLSASRPAMATRE